jgi:hypothetical protein
VEFSQPIKDLSAKAINYITLSNSCIRLVIGLDANYRTRIRRFDLHLWTLTATEHIKKKIYKGDHVNSRALPILLEAFGPPAALASKYTGADLDKKIILSFDDLVAC